MLKTSVTTVEDLIKELQKINSNTRVSVNNIGKPPTLLYDEDRKSVIIGGQTIFEENEVDVNSYIDLISDLKLDENDAFQLSLKGYTKKDIVKICDIKDLEKISISKIFQMPLGKIAILNTKKNSV
jgi:hypothetical protein